MASIFSKKQQDELKVLKSNKVEQREDVASKSLQFRMESMTNREREIFVLIKKGLTSKECAAALGISVRTVEVHRANLIQKYRVKNIVELVFRINQEERTKPTLH
ncbi:helix-turn-helix transcriptional regulator [Oligella ureolytica]|nr:helix-turn-helix transcriptional regulator [Alcaligenaceae bacterium]HZJ96351.1 LuxR C-terminal-related transcriptional regulator [Oligella sp.]